MVITVSTRTREYPPLPGGREGVMVSTVSTRTREYPPLPGGREGVMVSTESTRARECCEYLVAAKTWSKWNRFVSLSGNGLSGNEPNRQGGWGPTQVGTAQAGIGEAGTA